MSVATVIGLAVWATSAPAKDKEAVLHAFTLPNDGAAPVYGLTADDKGNLYGTTYSEHKVFKLIKSKSGWTMTIISNLAKSGWPPSGVIFDKRGNLYGTTQAGPICGAVFELSPTKSGQWVEKCCTPSTTARARATMAACLSRR
ncbi:MAG: choice-of-anchor tandem repeat GloVer-containing protein [Rhizomicrobium sp.]